MFLGHNDPNLVLIQLNSPKSHYEKHEIETIAKQYFIVTKL